MCVFVFCIGGGKGGFALPFRRLFSVVLFWGGCPFVLSCFSGVEVIPKMQCLHSKTVRLLVGTGVQTAFRLSF